MTVVTRFAPSPTGYLHIGGARTALFNWLFARHHGGRFLLRIEDTDRARFTEAAVTALIDGLTWLGLDWDGEAVSQFARAARHVEMVDRLIAEGKAYRCYATREELDAMRQAARAEGRPMRYDGRWRDRDPSEAPRGVPPVIRFRAPIEGETVIEDAVQGPVTVQNAQLDDMVLLRADGSPTYMLSVVVDDIDMGITHIIRGDDHLTNAFRQTELYRALGATPPTFAHVPLIHGPDGAKLSKRHGATGAEAYRALGYLPEAMRNYLLRLGWSHGDDEIISTEQAIAWFNLEAIGRAPARFDFQKLDSLNGHYIREAEDERVVQLLEADFGEVVGSPLTEEAKARLLAGMPDLKPRARTLKDLADAATVYTRPRPDAFDEKALTLVAGENRPLLSRLTSVLDAVGQDWTSDRLEAETRRLAEAQEIKLGRLAQPLRAAITGRAVSPPIFKLAEILGRETVLKRLKSLPPDTPTAGDG